MMVVGWLENALLPFCPFALFDTHALFIINNK